MTLQHGLERAERAARAGGALLRAAARAPKAVLAEAAHDVKLQADRDSEAAVLAVLETSGYGVLAEESGAHRLPADDAPYWVVDPLDGTANFQRDIPFTAVSIALCRGQRAVLGVVYDFMADVCYAGAPGLGAWRNGAAMRVSDIARPAEAILMTGFPSAFDFDAPEAAEALAAWASFKKIRMNGSAALAMAWVAAGHADAYAEDNIMLWDVAAGLALVEAAGGWNRVEPAPAGPWARRVRSAAKSALWGA